MPIPNISPDPNTILPDGVDNSQNLLKIHMDMIYKSHHDSLKSKLVEYDSLLKLDNRNSVLSKVIEERTNNIRNEVNELTTNYMNNRRQIQINNFEYDKKKQNIKILIFTSIVLIVSILITYLPIISTNFKKPLIFSLFILWLVVYLYNIYWDRKRKNNDWDEFLWGDLDNVKDNLTSNEEKERENLLDDIRVIHDPTVDYQFKLDLLNEKLKSIRHKIENSDKEDLERQEELELLNKLKDKIISKESLNNRGNIGNDGNIGNSGNSGNIGNIGNDGNIGNSGNSGNDGNIGNDGNDGNSGNDGNIGNSGNGGNGGNGNENENVATNEYGGIDEY